MDPELWICCVCSTEQICCRNQWERQFFFFTKPSFTITLSTEKVYDTNWELWDSRSSMDQKHLGTTGWQHSQSNCGPLLESVIRFIVTDWWVPKRLARVYKSNGISWDQTKILLFVQTWRFFLVWMVLNPNRRKSLRCVSKPLSWAQLIGGLKFYFRKSWLRVRH